MWKTLRSSVLSRWMVAGALAIAYSTVGMGCWHDHHDDRDRGFYHDDHHDDHHDMDHDHDHDHF